MSFTSTVNKLLGIFGVGMHRVRKTGAMQHVNRNDLWLHNLNVKTVIDVGANEGQFAGFMASLFPDAEIHSAEPIPEVFTRLSSLAEKVKNHNAYNVAFGAKPGKKVFYRNDFSQSSSFLPMTDLHKKSFTQTANETPEEIEVTTLDQFFATKKLARPLMLKIDVQGFELEVLKGADSLLKTVDILMLELSFVPLYAGQPLFHDVYTFCNQHGFELHGMTHILTDPASGQPLQVDGYFIRKKS